ncbi:hypothetical protein [[Phormidium] sp. ETS-05]|nr:hypothetical protein [[Phormidium] sp. ETS-05]
MVRLVQKPGFFEKSSRGEWPFARTDQKYREKPLLRRVPSDKLPVNWQ